MNTVVDPIQYVDDMIKRHKIYFVVRQKILDCVNSKYVRLSNNNITAIWSELNRRFPS